jgi:DNA-binding NarL/FixJ family response regulator
VILSAPVRWRRDEPAGSFVYPFGVGAATSTFPVRVCVVDDHQMVLDGLVAMLAGHSDRVVVVGQAAGAETAVAAVRACSPDVVLVDVRLRSGSGFEVCSALLSEDEPPKVVFLTVYDDEQYLFQALRLGASGYLLKRVTGTELADHLDRVMSGEIVIDPQLAGRVALSAARLHSGEFWPGAHLGLTQRESEVLGLMVRGLTNRAIARELVVAEETVKTHASAILRKLEVRDRTQAVAVAIREGLFR